MKGDKKGEMEDDIPFHVVHQDVFFAKKLANNGFSFLFFFLFLSLSFFFFLFLSSFAFLFLLFSSFNYSPTFTIKKKKSEIKP